jgi:hypothetical protein
MCRHGLSVFPCAAGFEVSRDARRAEGAAKPILTRVPRSAARRLAATMRRSIVCVGIHVMWHVV